MATHTIEIDETTAAALERRAKSRGQSVAEVVADLVTGDGSASEPRSGQQPDDARNIQAIHQLQDILQRCSQPDWGGDGELPVSASTALEADALLRALPSSFDNPEISPEPSGAIAFEWRRAALQIVVASVAGKGVVEYAGMTGPNSEFHGRVPFARELPDTVFRQLLNLKED
jgi:hypothetical protein